ncbi:pentapeptide repeat-containing protein [Crocosphaera watsonii WH 8501]|uniref:Pentapeptide repeat n=1 Tax=Crocosphaera watsonii WH 8501 TaxID=165597 RepID=Q4C826_CROWT|nr:Pentapeptide repeat [Crocosphaera watsonii WH 8501]
MYQDLLTLCSFYFLKAFSPSDYPLWEKLSRKSPNLRDADLRKADLTNANLKGALLTDPNLTGAKLTGANLTNPDSALQKVALNTTSLGLIIKYNCLSS